MHSPTQHRTALAILIVAALTLFAVRGPLFVAMPLGPDPVMYDLQARVVDQGGVLYRDILEPNLPGAVWIHRLVRHAAGWSSEALRAFDLMAFLIAAGLIATFPRLIGTSSRPSRESDALVTGLFTLLVVGGYTSLSEWCHCQRDVWTLPLMLGAIVLRLRRLQPSVTSEFPLRRHSWQALSSFLEGVLWGAAVWIKPHIALVAVSVLVAGVIASRTMSAKSVAKDLLDVVLGGMAVGALGVIWLVEQGAWPYLWSMLTEWNPQYLAASADRWSWGRFWSVQSRLAPWSLVPVLAVPLAVVSIASAIGTRIRTAFDSSGAEPPDIDATPVVASAAYLASLAQAFFFQHLFEYVYVPSLALGALVVRLEVVPHLAGLTASPRRFGYAAAACVLLPIGLRASQLRAWPRCVASGSTTDVRATLSVLPVPDWKSLADIHDYLAAQEVGPGEVTAYHTHTIHLLPWLGVDPSTRFVFTETHLRLFPAQAPAIERALAESPQKFVVTSLLEAGVQPDPDQGFANWRQGCSDESLAKFPFNQPVVFQSGPYLIHRVDRPPGPMETRFFPLAAKSAGL